MNLLNETIEFLKKNGLTPNDVLWVGSKDLKTDWDNFANVADIDYDGGFGGQEIAQDLLIVGSDWWMERGEYDGSEWWEFKRKPQEPQSKKGLRSVKGGVWRSLMEINNDLERE